MRPDRLDALLQQHVWDGPREPVSAECLGISAILRILDHPEDIKPNELDHLTECPACQRAVVLARREREIIETPWSNEFDLPEDEDEQRVAARAGTEPDRPRTIKLSPWLTGLPARAGIAAAVVLAVGAGWWLIQGRSTEVALLGPISGQFVLEPATRSRDATRSSEQQEKYAVSVDLNAPAYITFLYLDHTRKLKLPSDAEKQAAKFPAGPRRFEVTITADDPPGPQWITAIASETPFDPFRLRDELQGVIAGFSDGTPVGDLIEPLERALGERREFSFRSHSFEVPPADAP